MVNHFPSEKFESSFSFTGLPHILLFPTASILNPCAFEKLCIPFHIFRLTSKTFPVSINYCRGCIYQHTLHWYMLQTCICQNFGTKNFNLLLPINSNSLWDGLEQKDMSMLLEWYRNKVHHASVILTKVFSALLLQDSPSGAIQSQILWLDTTMRLEMGEMHGYLIYKEKRRATVKGQWGRILPSHSLWEISFRKESK